MIKYQRGHTGEMALWILQIFLAVKEWAGTAPPTILWKYRGKKKDPEIPGAFQHSIKVTDNSLPVDADVWHLNWIQGKHDKH